MGEKIVVGPINRGLRTDRTAFVIDNDSFPTLINAYQWRGRVKRKRGTSLLGRLQRAIQSTYIGNFIYSNGTINLITLVGGGSGASIVPGSLLVFGYNGQFFTEPSPPNGTLSGSGGATGTINYATGAIVLSNAIAGLSPGSGTFSYYPSLPVMGLEDVNFDFNQFPGTLGFDTTFSYNISTAFPYPINDVSYYKNPSADPINLPGYIPKTTWTATTWNGQNYQQFWTTNYQGSLWATNGITLTNNVFDKTSVGMQYKAITGVAIITAGNGTTIPAVADLTIFAHGLVQGDFIFTNEVLGLTGINFQTGYVTSANPQAANVVRVTFPFAILGGVYTSLGIAQYLTSRSDTTKDCLRWYDGDPTNGSATSPIFSQGSGWVNFCPPLSQSNYSISDTLSAQYYLVGARVIVPFKDRLLFFGPVIQTSVSGSQVYLPDTVIYSQNGTPYYTSSYFNSPNSAVDTPISPTNFFHPILTPTLNTTSLNYQTATSPAYFEDQTGFGGFISAGISQPILTVSTNEDVLIVGFSNIQTRFVYSGNDIVPFNFFLINSELGSGSTFSAVNLDKGVFTRGQRGYIITSQVETRRIDLDIPDQVFQIKLTQNGNERVCAQRDFINEWVYFTYPCDEFDGPFPNQTLQYNYRDDSWAIFNECYTTYGSFRKRTGFTWATVGTVYPSWSVWNAPWNAGSSNLEQPEVIAGNQQGFILVRDDGTDEGNSLTISNFSSSVVTSPSHQLNDGDYIIISGCIGTIGSQVNNRIFSVSNSLTDTFILNPSITSGTYLGGGLIKRLYVPQIQTKQFPVSWEMSRKTRIGPQQYLLSRTSKSQIQLLIFLSQDSSTAYNSGNIVPQSNVDNNSLIYSTVLFTCPESTNLGLTPSNINLNMVTATGQDQIWHRINTSLLGDTIQIGFTLSDDQMRSLDTVGTSFQITGATQANPCVLTCANSVSPSGLVLIEDVEGMIELNGNVYNVLSSNATSMTIDVDSTGFTAYTAGGTSTPISPLNQTAEIELHGFILDVSPSMVLA